MPSFTSNPQIPINHEDVYSSMDYAGPYWDGQPYSEHTRDSVSLVGSLTEGVTVSGQYGTTVQGHAMLAGTPDQIGVSYYFTFNPLLLSTMGSSAAFPVPVLVATTPRILAGASTLNSGVSQLNQSVLEGA